MYKRLLVLVVLVMAIGCAGQNIKTTNDYDGLWETKMYTGNTYNKFNVSVVNGRFKAELPGYNGMLKGYISADGRFSATISFNKGGYNHGAILFNLDRERSTDKRMVGTWRGLDGCYWKKGGEQYYSDRWEAIKK
jgi:hypothetical protein